MSSMVFGTPATKGEEKNWSKGGSPQSDTSGDTALTGESHTSVFSAESDQPQPASISTLEEQQEGLPEEIKNKTYPSSDFLTAEDELLEDLEKHSLLDSDKVIVVNQDGRAVWEMPSVFHQKVLQKILKIVNKFSGEEHPLLAEADIPLLVDKNGKSRHPDISIWGAPRLETEDEDGDFDQRYISIDGLPGENLMNPHVIIEFSWKNKLETEIWKLQQQIADHIQGLGVVKLGFLIKAKPTEGKKIPTFLDRNIPLSGFDVYRFCAGETATTSQALPDPFLEYRVGNQDADTMAIDISGTDLGHSNPEHGVSIPLSAIRRSCEKSGLVFQAEA